MFSGGDGAVLRTVSLRPTVMYGEGDKHYVINMLRTAKLNGGVLPKFGNCKALFQQVSDQRVRTLIGRFCTRTTTM